MHRNADSAGLIGDGAGYGLANPPGCVGREFIAAAIFEFIRRAHETDIAFLDQIQKVQATVDVLLGNRDDEAKIGFHQVFFGAFGFLFTMANYGEGVLQGVERSTGILFALANFPLQLADAGLLCRTALHFQFLQFAVQVVDLFHCAFNFAGEIAPLGDNPRHPANGKGSLHQRPRQLHGELTAQLLVDSRSCLQFVANLDLLPVVGGNGGKQLENLRALFQVSRGTFFDFAVAKVGDIVQIGRILAHSFCNQ